MTFPTCFLPWFTQFKTCTAPDLELPLIERIYKLFTIYILYYITFGLN